MRLAQHNLAPPTRKGGDPQVAAVLWQALQLAADDVVDREIPHRFHSWPAGMHPAIARTIVAAFPHGGVVDCFSGGGTVGLEALVHKRPFVGVDLNPLAARVGFQRCRPRSEGDAHAVEALVDEVVERSKERVRKKQRARADVPDVIAEMFLPHTLVEVAGLLAEIAAVDDEDARKLMAVVFSAILTKVSRKRGDTSGIGALGEKRVGRFFPSELFQEKAHELLDQQRALFRRIDGIGMDVPRPRFLVDDALRLPVLFAGKERAGLLLTSPPYGGTYDYARHHAHRIAFLGLDDTLLRRHELGARRKQQTRAEFDGEVTALLRACADVVDDRGSIVFLQGDAWLDGTLVPADAQLARLAPAAGLVVVASASAPRADWRSGSEREEHLVVLRRR